MYNKHKWIFCIAILLFFIFPQKTNAQVVVNEFSSYASSGDWVELYAREDTDVSNWILRDEASSVMTTISAGTIIGPTSANGKYYVIDAKNRLNVDTDTVKLLKADDVTVVDEIPYGNPGEVCAPKNETESVGRVDDGNTIERFLTITKSASNVGAQLDPCPTPTPEPTATPTNTPIPTHTPTATPNPTATPTKTPISTSTKTPTSKPTSVPTSEELVLGIQNSTPPPSASPEEEASSEKKFPIFPVILIVTGFLCIAGALFFFVKNNVKKDI